jgi:transposase
MGGSYSAFLRERAIRFVETEKGSPKVACAVLGIHSSTLTKWLKKYRETGETASAARPSYRTRKVDITILKQMVADNPDATLEELSQPFNVFPSTIFYHLKKLGITRKKNHALRGAERGKKAEVFGGD